MGQKDLRGMNKEIVLATNNKNKLREYREILSPRGYVVYSPGDLNLDSDPEETGTTYRENAFIKAKALIGKVNWPVIADDSGLEIEALGGFPGLRSARYAASLGGDYKKVCATILRKLEGEKNRRAAFLCTICLLERKDAKPLYFEGLCPGSITDSYKGNGGFGYDPIFHCVDPDLDFGTASEKEKNAVSHRARALRKLLVYLSI
jgi:XTP/dITP diphosphohydrolase